LLIRHFSPTEPCKTSGLRRKFSPFFCGLFARQRQDIFDGAFRFLLREYSLHDSEPASSFSSVNFLLSPNGLQHLLPTYIGFSGKGRARARSEKSGSFFSFFLSPSLLPRERRSLFPQHWRPMRKCKVGIPFPHCGVAFSRI